jgi:hypothetical protein
LVRAILPAKDGLQGLHVQRTPRPVQQVLIHLIECGSALEQQIPAQLQLIKRILILEPGPLLLGHIQGETQTRRIKPEALAAWGFDGAQITQLKSLGLGFRD